jgi:hypothetical protein
MGWMIACSISGKGCGISLLTTASGPVLGLTQPPIQWVTGALSFGVNRPGREADHSTPSGADIKKAWNYTSTPPVLLRGVVLRKNHRDNFTFTF